MAGVDEEEPRQQVRFEDRIVRHTLCVRAPKGPIIYGTSPDMKAAQRLALALGVPTKIEPLKRKRRTRAEMSVALA